MNTNHHILPLNFQKYFWDVAFDELSFEKYPRFIAERLMNYGNLGDMKWLLTHTNHHFLSNLIETSRNLNDKTQNYWQILLSDTAVTFDHFINFNNIRLAGLKDIAAMKLEAIAGRGSKKDFIDLFFLLQQFSLEEIFSFHTQKYGIGLSNQYHHLKSLIYFADAEEEAMPLMIRPLEWGAVKQHIISVTRRFAANLEK